MKEKIKIMFLNSWGESHAAIADRYNTQTPNSTGIWENIQSTTNPNEADYYIMMQNEVSDYPDLPDHKKIYFQREPPYIQNRSWYTNPSKNYCHYGNCHSASTWWIDKPFNFLSELQYPEKNKMLSTIASAQYRSNGHKLRLDFIREYVSKHNNMDVYGSGHGDLGACNKGPTPTKCKFDTLINYKYSLSCENGAIRNYFTEKICDCFLAWTVPIYWGCPNISNFFPEHSFHSLDITNPDSFNILNEIMKQPIEDKHIKALQEARNLVLYKYNIWPTIKGVLDQK